MARSKSKVAKAPAFGDLVEYHDPESGRIERAAVIRAYRPDDPASPVDLLFVDGWHDVIARDVEPDPGKFGGYRKALAREP
jgi:hypothetical protein